MEFNETNPTVVEEVEVLLEDPGAIELEMEDKELDNLAFLLTGPAPAFGTVGNMSIRVR